MSDLSADLPWRSVSSGRHPAVQGPPPAGYFRKDPLRLDGGVSVDAKGCGPCPRFLRLRVKIPRVPAPGMPSLVYYGSLGMGGFTVRPPSGHELRRIAGQRNQHQLGR